MKISRRKLAAAVMVSSAGALAQTQPAATPSPDEELKIARDRMRANADALAAQKIPMAVEPAFQFKA